MEIFISYFVFNLAMIFTAGSRHYGRHLNETEDEKPILLIAGTYNLWAISSIASGPKSVVSNLESNYDIDFDYAKKKLYYVAKGIYR